jgi:predicted phage baseplate assembly protein
MSQVLDPSLQNLNDCGCCEGLGAQTPVEVVNLPGLSAIAYRVGTHSQFKASMLASLSSFDNLALSNLRTRDDDDFSLALLDAWATVADVLTFYQERIANESYLRTATERFSLLQLARLIGYELQLGVAASTYLAFTIENVPGAPGQATIGSGTRVQSIPNPGEQPQTFETVEQIEARVEWNALKPRLTQTLQLTKDQLPELFQLGVPFQMTFQGITINLKPGDRVLIVILDNGQHYAVLRRVKDIVPDRTTQTTVVDFTDNEVLYKAVQTSRTGVFALRTRASLFGVNAPDWNAMPNSVKKNYGGPTGSDWKLLDSISRSANQFDLDAVYSQIIPDNWMVLTRLDSSTSEALANEEGTQIPEKRADAITQIHSVEDTGVAGYALSARVTQIRPIRTSDLSVLFSGIENMADLRRVAIYLQSEQLTLAEQPLADPIQGNQIVLDRIVSGLQQGQKLMVSGKRISAQDEVVSEIAFIKDTPFDNGHYTTITLNNSLQYAYDRTTVTIYANVALATHGERVQEEMLGSGDASQPYQSFTLRQSPLTYTSASTASGAASTLQVRVNDIEWHEVPSLYGHGPRDRVFVTRTSSDGKTTVEFGDGITGARPPTGQENVRATYRKGIGVGGLVKAGQLSLLMTRSLGVKSVINPQAPSGAADPESVDDARRNAPLAALTLERIVSLQDYEDFARAFAGIAKALATWTWSGLMRAAFVTVAGPNGAEVRSDSALYTNLLSAMQKAGDSYIPIRILSYRQAFFRLAAKVKVNGDYRTDLVLAAVEQALRTNSSFDARSFGQPVMLSEVIAIMQAVPGIVAVDVYRFYRTDDTSTLGGLPPPSLPAAGPQAGAGTSLVAAELLTLAPGPLDDLGVIS